MLIIGIISQALLYLCFALTLGSFILYLVPNTHRPDIHVPKGALMMATGGIAIFSFFPVLQLILYLSPDIGFSQTLAVCSFYVRSGKSVDFYFHFIEHYYLFLSFGLIIEKRLYMQTLEFS